ncbi:hypothetical protein LOTGIDRAFT_157202 [Lottia gigantea]|uniref:Uncharacterized protein n=1 Tax=Lottia gigantea TaxID=225164 RepID=V4B3U0_LOTGI|nr:hypothetical protein LOTGIDRAFT_157202 [Lottia gigantea]ESP02061.1 hypothetical protein LOTGIDRAFT_157202 [Lottia gigantea]
MAASRRSHMSTLTMVEALAMIHSSESSDECDSDEDKNYVPSETTTDSDDEIPPQAKLDPVGVEPIAVDAEPIAADAEPIATDAEPIAADVKLIAADAEPDAEDADQPKIKRRKRPAVNEWKSSVIKEKHLHGESFKNRKGQDRPAAKMGPPCKSA